MQYVLSIIDKLNLLVRKFASKLSRNEIIFRDQFKRSEINSDKDKSVENKNVKGKNVRSVNVNKIMRINNAFLIDMLIFCDKESENKSLKLLHFKRSKNIKSLLTFLFLNAYFNV